MRWVTFDCFGTLVDWRSGFAAILTPVFGDKTPDAMRVYDRFERILEAETPHRQYRDVLTAGLLRAAEDIGVPLSESQARRLPEQWGTMPVFADVEPMLAGLRAEGCRLAMLTNCDEDLFAETQRAFRAPFDLVDDGLPASRFILEEAETVAAKLGVQLVVVKAPPGHYDRAFVELAARQVDALCAVGSAIHNQDRKRLIALTARHRLPAIWEWRYIVEEGGLMSYGASEAALSQRVAVYVDKLLKGAKPAELPVEQPTTLEFSVNLTTAKTLGLTIPPSVLIRADHVIQ